MVEMRLELLVGMLNELLNGHHRSLFKRLIWKETWTLRIEDSSLIFYATRCTMYTRSRNPRWPKFMSLFKWAVWKETCDDHSGVRSAFRRAVRVSSPPSTPYSISTIYTLFHQRALGVLSSTSFYIILHHHFPEHFEWSSQVSFQTAHLKRDVNFESCLLRNGLYVLWICLP